MRDFEPKALMWRRFYVVAVVPAEHAAALGEHMWSEYQPAKKRRTRVTSIGYAESEHESVREVALMMEYAARGANSLDVRRRVWKALGHVAQTDQVQARVEARCIASAWLDFADYSHNDKQWLEDKMQAASDLTDELLFGSGWSDIADGEGDEDDAA